MANFFVYFWISNRIGFGEELEAYPAASKSQTDAQVIYQLRDLGKTSAQQWLQKPKDSI